MNYYAISALINLIANIVIGSLVFIKNPKSRQHLTFTLFCGSVAFWSVFYWLWQSANSTLFALAMTRSLMFGAIWIPTFFYHYTVILLGNERKFRHILIASYVMSAILSAADLFSPLVVSNIQPRLGFQFWPIPGYLFHAHFLMFAALVLSACYLLLNGIKRHEGRAKLQLRYSLVATVIGFGGGMTNYFLWYNVPIKPYLNSFVSFYTVVIAYAMLRHRLMDIGLIARDVLTKIFTVFLVGLPLLVGRVLAQTLITWPASALSRTVGTLAASLVDFSIALSLLRRTQDTLTRHLIRFFLFLSLWNTGELVLVASPTAVSVWLYRLAYVTGILVMLAWYDLWNVYIQDQTSRRQMTSRILHWSSVAMAAVAFFSPGVLAGLNFDRQRLRPAMEIPGPFYSLFSGWFLGMVIAIGLSLAHLIVVRKSRERMSIAWIWTAYLSATVAVLSYFAYVKGLLIMPLHTGLEICASAAILGAYLHHPQYAEQPRWTHFGLGAAALVLPFGAGFLLTQGMFCQVMAGLLLVAVVPRIFRGLEDSVQTWVDENIFQGRFSYLNQLAGIRKQAFRYINLRDMLVQSLDSVVRAMRLQSGALYLHNLTANAYEAIVTYPDDQMKVYGSYSESDPLVETLKRERQMSIPVRGLSHHALALTYEKDLFGFFLLGPKEDGTELHEADFRELSDLRGALEHVLWYTHVFHDQSLMLSKFSHDNIRYANNIRQQVEALLNPRMGNMNDFQKHVVHLIERSARMLEEYLQDLRVSMTIAAQRIGGTYHMDRYNLGELVLEVRESQHLRAEKEGIQLTSSLLGLEQRSLEKFTAWGEMRSIRHVIENLLSNAIKFTPKGGAIRLDLKHLGDQLELVVSDTGPGIPDEDLPHIFDLFYQGKSRRNMHESTGLGLSIVKEIVAIHHGNIDVESENGQGTTFFVRLPVQPFASAKAA